MLRVLSTETLSIGMMSYGSGGTAMSALHPTSRRRFLGDLATSAGSLALAWLLDRDGIADASVNASTTTSPVLPKPPHFTAKAKRVLQIFCPGAASHIDLWEHKPELARRHGQPMPGDANVVTFQGGNGNLMTSPWSFSRRGKSGKMI